jgi:phage terminase large subunit-like protein
VRGGIVHAPQTFGTTMLLELSERICCGAPDRIEQAIVAIDPQATVAVNSVSGSVPIEGGVSKEQAIAALASAGFTARSAHVSGGSDCCGGCS